MDLRQRIRTILQKLDFSEMEIAFYMLVLKHPGKSIFHLAKSLGIPKNRAYTIYSLLENKGLLASASQGWKKKVVPTSLHNLVDKMNKQSRDLGKIADSLKEINKYLPLLDESHNVHKIRYIGDLDTIRNTYLDLLDDDYGYLLAYGGFDRFIEDLGYDNERDFIKKRVRKGKMAQGIFASRGQYTIDIIKHDKEEMRESLLIDDDNLKKQWVYIFPESKKSVIWSRNCRGVMETTIIESPQVAETHEAVFNHLRKKQF